MSTTAPTKTLKLDLEVGVTGEQGLKFASDLAKHLGVTLEELKHTIEDVGTAHEKRFLHIEASSKNARLLLRLYQQLAYGLRQYTGELDKNGKKIQKDFNLADTTAKVVSDPLQEQKEIETARLLELNKKLKELELEALGIDKARDKFNKAAAEAILVQIKKEIAGREELLALQKKQFAAGKSQAIAESKLEAEKEDRKRTNFSLAQSKATWKDIVARDKAEADLAARKLDFINTHAAAERRLLDKHHQQAIAINKSIDKDIKIGLELNLSELRKDLKEAEDLQTEFLKKQEAQFREAVLRKETYEKSRRSRASTVDTGALTRINKVLEIEKQAIISGAKSIEVFRIQQSHKRLELEREISAKLRAIRVRFASRDLTVQEAAREREAALERYRVASLRVHRETEKRNKEHLASEQKISKAKANQLKSTNSQNKALKRTTHLIEPTLLNSNKKLLKIILKSVAGYRAMNFLINSVQRSLLSIPKAGIAQQANIAALTGTFGSTLARKELAFVSEVADEYGLSLEQLEGSFAKFAPSARLAGASLAEVNQIFKDFSAVGTVLHKTPDQMDAIFLALEQMFAKGKVQSEEIKKQLGNQLPAAIAIAAEAVGRTPKAFMKAMEMNLIIAKDAVPKIAALYKEIFAPEKVLGTISQQLQAQWQRLITRSTVLSRELFARSKAFMNKFVTSVNKGLEVVIDNLDGIIQGLQAIAIVIAVRVVGAIAVTTSHIIAMNLALLATKGGLNAIITMAVGAAAAFLHVNAPIVLAIAGVTTLIGLFLKLSGVSLKYGKENSAQLEVQTKLTKEWGDLVIVQANANAKIAKLKKDGASEDDARIVALEKVKDLQFESLEGANRALDHFNEVQQKSNAIYVNMAGKNVTLSNALSATWEHMWGEAKKGMERLMASISETISAISSLYTEFTVFMGIIYDVIVHWLEASSTALLNKVKESILDVKSLHDDFIGDLTAQSLAIAHFFKTGSLNSYEETREEAEAATKSIVEWSNALAETLKTTYNKYLNIGVDGVTSVTTAVAEGTGKAVDAALETIDELSVKAKAALDDLQKHIDATTLKIATSAESKDKIALQAKLDALEDKFQEQWEKHQQDLKDSKDAKTKAQLAYLKSLEDTEIILLRLQGYTHKANVLQIQRDTERKLAAIKGDKAEEVAARKRLEQIRTLKLKNADIAAETVKAREAEKKYNNEVAKTTALAKLTGSDQITLLDTLHKLREDQILQQEQYLRQLREEAALTAELSPAAIAAIDAQQGRVDALIAQREGLPEVAPAGGSMLHSFSSGFGILDKADEDQASLDRNFSTYEDAEEQRLDRIFEEQLAKATSREAEQKAAEEHHEGLLNIEKVYAEKSFNISMNKGIGISQVGADVAMGLTKTMVKMYGEESKQARIAFAAYKAFAIAKTIIATSQGVMSAITTSGNIYVGIAMAAMVAAMGAVEIATIIAQPMPSAHGGLDYVPKEQTYLLDKGERVLSPSQNKDFTQSLARDKQQEATPPQDIKIINTVDPEVFNEFLESEDGERVIMNTVRRNEAA